MFVFLLASMMILSTPFSALATEMDNNLINENKIIENMNYLGIEKTAQSSLIDKIRNGELPDSDNPEKVKQISSLLNVSENNPKVEYTFADGSKIRLEIVEIGNNEVAPCGTRITKEIKVKESTTFTTGEFKAKVLYDWDYPRSEILRVWDERVTVVAGDYWDPKLRIIQRVQTDSDPAHARLSFKYQYQIKGRPIVTGTAWIDLFVDQHNHWTDITT
ncbi:hypothetical protein [Thermosyntropha sp.]|uniref:hypothetical protein n=1 Tax=Thermosyntropha sp. TaxID=2740820 RepID=UPI0025D44C3E|nr:hypothetical protein [Thermosyntropha sp.]MBO8158935.1 hypothetical protein [Thermosyntropha sp.]